MEGGLSEEAVEEAVEKMQVNRVNTCDASEDRVNTCDASEYRVNTCDASEDRVNTCM